MHITQIYISGFKKFSCETFSFNDDLNIIVGDNDSGKSTLLEAIELVVNGRYRGKSVTSEITPELFNVLSKINYFSSDYSSENLPSIKIEIYLEGCPNYRGINNTQNIDAEGITLDILFDSELQAAYNDFIKDNSDISTIPTEFYKVNWQDFSWNKIKYLNREAKSLLIDPSRLHPTYGKSQYIGNIIDASLDKKEKALLSLNYRQLRQSFNEQPQVKDINNKLDADNMVTEQCLSIVADISNNQNIESGLQLAVDDINFPLIGKGEQNQIQIKLAIANKAANIDFVMVEEPENHLSHMNLSRLISKIAEQHEKQLFITTHSSYVLNKLNIKNLCLIGREYKQLKDINKKVARILKRLPGYDTLRIALASKVILVEGPSDELILKKIYLQNHKKLPEEDGIDIIVVRGIGFKSYLEIAKHIGTTVHVVKDNDGSYQKNIIDYGNNYAEYDFISFFSHINDSLNSLEPTLIAENNKNDETLDMFARIVLSTQTYRKYNRTCNNLTDKQLFLKEWYGSEGENFGGKKVDSAIRVFDSEDIIAFPKYLVEALCFG
ncbi:ATP-dependent nuclease [Pseudocolwellia sp. HL-MZ19]|uniref:ATP-dependent nuclease n=1 Tax=Pseudocolwellia sp. HL-MZ19 TaxID=3400846 RepID=UPI003CECE3BC